MSRREALRRWAARSGHRGGHRTDRRGGDGSQTGDASGLGKNDSPAPVVVTGRTPQHRRWHDTRHAHHRVTGAGPRGTAGDCAERRGPRRHPVLPEKRTQRLGPFRGRRIAGAGYPAGHRLLSERGGTATLAAPPSHRGAGQQPSEDMIADLRQHNEVAKPHPGPQVPRWVLYGCGSCGGCSHRNSGARRGCRSTARAREPDFAGARD